MKYWYQKPHPDLCDVVRTVLIIEGFSEPSPVKVPLFTRGMPAFLCITEGPASGGSSSCLALFGKSVPDEWWNTTETNTIIAYFFKPFSLAPVFDIPAAKLAADSFDLGNWSPQKINAFKTQLLYSSSTLEKLNALDNFLLREANANRKNFEIVRYATDQMMHNSNPEVLSNILGHLNLAERTLQRIFKKYVGVTPNHYRRICQFQLSFSQLRAKEFNALTDVAFDNGFADQSHFIRSFKEFTDTTPNDYVKSGLKKNR